MTILRVKTETVAVSKTRIIGDQSIPSNTSLIITAGNPGSLDDQKLMAHDDPWTACAVQNCMHRSKENR